MDEIITEFGHTYKLGTEVISYQLVSQFVDISIEVIYVKMCQNIQNIRQK